MKHEEETCEIEKKEYNKFSERQLLINGDNKLFCLD